MASAAFTLNVSAEASALLGGMKGVSAWRGEMAESTEIWLLAPGCFASGQDLYRQPEHGFVNARTSKLSAGRTGNLQCSTLGEKGRVQSQCYFLLSSWVCFRLKIDLIETS